MFSFCFGGVSFGGVGCGREAVNILVEARRVERGVEVMISLFTGLVLAGVIGDDLATEAKGASFSLVRTC